MATRLKRGSCQSARREQEREPCALISINESRRPVAATQMEGLIRSGLGFFREEERKPNETSHSAYRAASLRRVDCSGGNAWTLSGHRAPDRIADAAHGSTAARPHFLGSGGSQLAH